MATKKAINTKLAYRYYSAKESGGQYGRAYLEILSGHTVDAAKEYDDHAECSNADYYIERLKQIRNAGSSTQYFRSRGGSSDSIEITWQSSDGLDGWYGDKIQGMPTDPATAKLWAKLSKAFREVGYEWTPAQAVEVLEKMGAKRVTYDSDAYDAWIFRPALEPEEFDTPWEAEARERAEADTQETTDV